MGDNKSTIKRVAEERINTLLDISERFFKNEAPDGVDEELARKYISLALQIRRHYKIKSKDPRLGTICKKCHTMLIPGVTCTVRVLGKEHSTIYKCLHCDVEKRIIFSKTA